MGPKSKLAIFPNGIDSILIPGLEEIFELYFLAPENSEEAEWIAQFLPAEKIIHFKLESFCSGKWATHYERTIVGSDLDNVLKQAGLTNILVTGQFTGRINEWAVKNGIEILGTPYETQSRYENKLWFDKFCKKHGINTPASEIYTCPGELKLLDKGKVVLQEEFSRGAVGTYFIDSKAELAELIKAGKIVPGKQYLARKFVAGRSLAMEMLIIPGMVCLSGVREVCLTKESINKRHFFTGHQWLPAVQIPWQVKENFNKTFKKLGKIMYREKYFGFGGFDLIVTPESEVFIIECNARFTGGSPLLVKYHELTNGINSGKVFLGNYFKRDNYPLEHKFLGFPDYTFQGALFYINIIPEITGKPVTVKHTYPSGIYELLDNKISFLDPDFRKLDQKGKKFIYLQMASKGDLFKEMDEFAVIYANFPLYNLDLSYSRDLQKIVEHFKI